LIVSYESSVKKCSEISDLYSLASEENNNLIIEECIKKIEELKIKTKKNETKCFLSKESDILDCYIEIHAGAGGTESQDWALMLKRMYMRWATDKKCKIQLISEHKGEEAGINHQQLKLKEIIYTDGLKKNREYIGW